MNRAVKRAGGAAAFLFPALLLVLAPVCGAQQKSPAGIAPDFTREDLANHSVHLGAYRGKVVLLNFWATWCAPCLQEMPQFAAWQSRYADRGLRVIGVSMDDSSEPVKRLQKRLAVNYPLLMGDERLGRLYGGILGLPVTFLIDRQGKIRAHFQGEVDLKALEREIQLMLAAEDSPGSRH